MSSEISTKLQLVVWWITSIAVSVLCCSVLFVLFASYLVDVKEAVRDSNERITALEERDNRILTEIELIRKHAVLQPTPAQPAPTDAVVAPSGDAPAAAPVVAPAVPAAPAVAQPAAPVPTTVVPVGTAVHSPAAVPAVSVPVISAPADKK